MINTRTYTLVLCAGIFRRANAPGHSTSARYSSVRSPPWCKQHCMWWTFILAKGLFGERCPVKGAQAC